MLIIPPSLSLEFHLGIFNLQKKTKRNLKLCICHIEFYSIFFLIFIFTLFYFTILYWFWCTLTWIHQECTWVPNPEPSGSSPCTSPKHPVSCIKHILMIHFLYDSIHVLVPFSQITPPSLSPSESKSSS